MFYQQHISCKWLILQFISFILCKYDYLVNIYLSVCKLSMFIPCELVTVVSLRTLLDTKLFCLALNIGQSDTEHNIDNSVLLSQDMIATQVHNTTRRYSDNDLHSCLTTITCRPRVSINSWTHLYKAYNKMICNNSNIWHLRHTPAMSHFNLCWGGSELCVWV